MSPGVALNKTAGLKEEMEMSCKCVCHAVRSRGIDRGCFWFMLCQSVSLSNNKMAVLGFMPLLDLYLETLPPTFVNRHDSQEILPM